MMKRLISIVLTAAMLLQPCSVLAFAEGVSDSGTCGENVFWELDNNGVLTISGTGAMTDFTFYEDTWSCGTPWGVYAGDIKSVKIENGVSTIGDYAFWNLYNLSDVDIPDSVTSIGDYAFCYTCLSAVTIPEKVTVIGACAFYYTCIETVTIPDSVITVGAQAFADIYYLQDVHIGRGVTELGKEVFRYCSSLAELTVDAANTAYCCEDGVLYNKDQTELLLYLPGKTQMEFAVPDSVRAIEKYAFNSCYNLTSVIFPGDAPDIGEYAFNGICATCYYPQNNDTWTEAVMQDYGGDLTWELITNEVGSGTCGDGVRWALTDTGVLTISGTGSMWDNSCTWPWYLEEITSVVVEEGVTRIGDGAFQNCENLEEVRLADSVKTIGEGAFYYCDKLKTVELGNGITYIADEAFYHCTSLERISIPSGTMLGALSFAWCTGLEEVFMLGIPAPSHGVDVFQEVTATAYCKEPYGAYYGPSYGEDLTWVETTDFGTCGETQRWHLVDGVLTIAGTGAMETYALDSFTGKLPPWNDYKAQITQVVIQEGITTVGAYAFANCEILTSVSLPESLTYIAIFAFRNCKALQEVVIPERVDSIGFAAFSGCTKLSKVEFLGDAPEIADYVFSDVAATCYYPLNNATWTAEVTQNYGGNLTWEAVAAEAPEEKDTEAPTAYNEFGGLALPLGYSGGKGDNALVAISISAKDNVAVAGVRLEYAVGDTYVLLTELTSESPSPVFHGDYMWDVSALDSGSYTVRATIYDTSGNVSEPIEDTAYVDNTAPTISNWEAVSEGNTVTLNWSCDDRNATYFVYAGWEDEPGSVLYAEGIQQKTCGYTTQVSDGKHYFYITAADSLGNESTSAVSVVVVDTCPPVLSVTPSVPYGAAVRGEISFQIHAVDTVGLSAVRVTYGSETKDISNGTMSLNTADLPDGELTVAFTAEDITGQTTQVVYVYSVDNTPPAAPEDLMVMAGQMRNTLSWRRSTELNTRTRIYRGLAEAGERTLVAELFEGDSIYNAFEDTDVTAGTAYYYWVTAVDVLGNESLVAGPVSGVPEADTTAPEITAITPVNGSTLTGKTEIRVTAVDNVQVQSISLACSVDGESWMESGTIETTQQAMFSVETTAFTGEKLYLKIIVLDIFGNQTENSTTYVYPLDNTPPEQVSGLTAATSATTITLNWNDVAAQDFAYFVVEQLVGESYQQVKTVNDALGVYFTGLEPDTAYTYRVYAVDRCGNRGEPSESLTVTTVADTTAPVIAAITPEPGSYNGDILLTFTVSDDQGVQGLSVQTSDDGIRWEEHAVVDIWRVGTSVAVSYRLDTRLFQEGILYVRAVATDLSGNVGDSSHSAPYCQYFIDRTAPAVPVGLTATAAPGQITLNWMQGSESDLGTYTIYRALQPEGPFAVLASGLKQLYLTDHDVEYGATYYYQIDVTDQTGNRSSVTDVVGCTALLDEIQPQVVSVSPSDGYILGSNTAIQVKVWDNHRVAALYYQISTDDGITWRESETILVSEAEQVVKLPVIQSAMESDFRMQFWCVDAAGQTSELVQRSYRLDKTAPQSPAVTAMWNASETAVELRWEGGFEEDLAGYRVYRAAQGEGYRLLTQKTGGESRYTYLDRTAKAGKTYSYYVEAVDVRGNTAQGAAAQCTLPEQGELADQTAPVAVIEGSSVCATHYETVFDAARSWDNVGVTAYLWDFGDGTTADTVRAVHAYATAGIYTVELTVWDAAGNTAKESMTVTVRDPEALGTLTITVQDESGQVVGNAGVYVDLGRENMSVVYTDANGMAQVRVSAGTHAIGVYKEGYLPAQRTAEVAAGSSVHLTVSVIERDIVVGELTVERMTLEQIREAGIDVSDPANQDVYEFNIKLTYGTYEYILSGAYNGDGDMLVDPEPIEIDEEEEIRKLVAWVIPGPVGPGGGGGGGGGGGSGGGHDDAEVPMVVVLDIPGTASWLKDFFDVRLTVINQADSQFVLDNCNAHLNVPAGLTLMDTNRTTASPDVDLGSIAGQESATAEWILRGDKSGYYDLKADFSAVLRDFNTAVNAQFQTAEPIQVRQGDGLTLEVVVENAIVADTDGAIRVGLRNDHEEPYYLPNIALDEDLVTLEDQFKTDGRVIQENPDMEVLKTGETIWWDYLVPRENWDVLTKRSGEDFYLLEAIVESLGGTTELQHEIQEVMPFTINGDLIVVTRLSPSGAESEISYVNIAKSNLVGGSVPSLAIRTYRQNKETHEYEPCSMEITIKDEHMIKRGSDQSGNEVGEGGITVTTDKNGYYCYEGYSLTNLYNTTSYNIRISASRAKPVEIPVVMRGSSVVTGLLTVYTYTGSGDEIEVLEGAAVTMMEADSTNATGITDEDGKIVFKKVDQGYQELIITKDGYLPLRELVEVGEESEYSFRLYEDTDPNSTRILQVSNSLTDCTKGNQTIIPEGGIKGTIQFSLKVRMAEGETFDRYHYRIVGKDGTIRDTDTFQSDNGFWLDLEELKAGDRLEFAVENTDGKISAFTDSNILVFEQPDFFNGLVYDLSKIQMGGSVDTASCFEFDPFATLKTLWVSSIAQGVEVKDDEKGFQAAALEYLNQYVFTNTKVTQSFPLTAKYDLSGKLTISVICGGSAETKTSAGASYGAGVMTSAPNMTYISTVEMSQSVEQERKYSGNIQLDFVFQYEPEKDIWALTVYLGASASQKLLDKDVTVLAVGYLAGEAELKESVKLEVAQTHVGPGDAVKLFNNGLVPNSFNAEGEVKGSVGLAVVKKKLASVGVYAKAGLEFQFLPYWSLTAKTALGAEGNVLLWKKEKDLISGEWEASGDASTASMANLALLELQNDGQPLSVAGPTRENAGWQANQDGDLWMTDAYSNADLQLAALPDGSILAVWCDYTEQADDPVVLYWSVYEEGIWSEPVQVDNDGTADLYPSLVATDTGAQLVWVDFTGSVAEMDKLSYEEIQQQAFAMLGVTTATYTVGDGWSSAKTISEGALAAAPKVAVGEDGSVLVGWISNAANLEEATAQDPDSICWTLIEDNGLVAAEGSIAAPYANLVALELGYRNGYQMSVLAEQSNDGVKLYTTQMIGNSWNPLAAASSISGDDTALAMTTDGVSYVIHSGCLYAWEDGTLRHLMDSELLPESAGEVTCVESEQGTILLWTCKQDADSAVCMVLVDSLGTVHTPVVAAVTSDGLLTAPMAAVSGASLQILFQHAYLQDNLWQRDMEIRTVPMGVDLSLENSLIQHSSHLVPGLSLETYVQVDSLGALVPETMTVEIYSEKEGVETVIAQKSGSSSLNVTLQWTVPADYAGEPVFVRVVHQEDCNDRNNVVQLNNLVREMALSEAVYIGRLEEQDIFTVDVENQGLVTSETTVLQVRIVGSDNLLLEREIAAMAPGAVQTLRLELDALDRTEAKPLIFSLTPLRGEGDESNNKAYVILPVEEEPPMEIASVEIVGTYTYNGQMQTASVVVKDAQGTVLTEGVDYQILSGQTATNAGSCTLTVAATETGEYIGTASTVWTIERAVVTITAEDQLVCVNGTMPVLTWRVEGLLGEDALLTEPGLNCDADPTQCGTYEITMDGADAGDNYNILYENGMLTVAEHLYAAEAVFQWAADYSGAVTIGICQRCQHPESFHCEVSVDAQERELNFTAVCPTLNTSDVQTIQLDVEDSLPVLRMSLHDQGVKAAMKVIFAAYDGNGRLLEAQIVDAPEQTISITVKGAEIRAFFMDPEGKQILLPYLKLAQ